jgi:hypothetical protein
VCQFPLYYSISFRNPKTGEIEGIDADLSKELAKELGAELEIVESSFGTFIADLLAEDDDESSQHSQPTYCTVKAPRAFSLKSS